MLDKILIMVNNLSQEWTRATHIRLRLLKVKTLLADLLPLARQDPTVTRRVWTNLGFKDGAYYCYCAYILHISRYSDFLLPMLTNTGIFLRGLKLSGETRS